ncbi:MAG TPA: hypothetical protein VGK26_01370 [Thermoanaerobaculia bacterium]|jgi:uncharacterized membrane protein
MNASKSSRTLLVAALAGMLALPAVLSAQGQKPAPDDGDKKPCWGVNKCKGLGDCGAEGCRNSGCHGSNACKGQGFLRINPDTCLKIRGGSLTKAAASAKHAPTTQEKKTS